MKSIVEICPRFSVNSCFSSKTTSARRTGELVCHIQKETDPPFWVPPKLYVVGMMNTADRSLTRFDYAFRRRFAFITLDPQLDRPEFRVALESASVPSELVTRIIARMGLLNDTIRADAVNLVGGRDWP